MKKIFVKKEELILKNGNHLHKEDIPVSNESFYKAQKEAEYICTFAELAKTKNFKVRSVDSIEQLRKEVAEKLSKKSESIYFDYKVKPQTPLNDSLKKEATDYIEILENIRKAEKLNGFMQKFNVIKTFEEVGLYFDEGLSTLDEIYTISQIKEALEMCVDLIC